MTGTPVKRDRFGRYVTSGNPAGRLPRQTETAYLDATMRECTPVHWAEIIRIAREDAMDMENSAHVRGRAREWLSKIVIGDSSYLREILYKEEKEFRIIVTFGDNRATLMAEPEGEIVDVEPVLLDESRDQS